MTKGSKASFLIPSSFLEEEEYIEIRQGFKNDIESLAAVTVFLAIKGYLRNNGLKISKNNLKTLAYKIHCPISFLEACTKHILSLSLGSLREKDDFIHSPAITLEIERYEALLSARKVWGKKGGESRKVRKNNKQVINSSENDSKHMLSTSLAYTKHNFDGTIYVLGSNRSCLDDLVKNCPPKTIINLALSEADGESPWKSALRLEIRHLAKLISEYGDNCISAVLYDASLWVQDDPSANARKYRRPNHEHYLFLKGWIERRGSGVQKGLTLDKPRRDRNLNEREKSIAQKFLEK